jgi:hypothetical protein
MAIARARLVDLTLPRWYHCMSRCVRGAIILSGGTFDRKQWIEDRLELLGQVFAAAVGGFAVLVNHLHVLLRLDAGVADG